MPERECKQVVIIGNGMVGHRLCEHLVERTNTESHQVVVIGEERRHAYDRVNLTSYLSNKSFDELKMADTQWYWDNGIVLHTDRSATRIDRSNRCIHLSCGSRVPYDYAVLATGSSAFVPDVHGVGKEGVFVYRTLDDLDSIRDYAKDIKRAAVIGGGLLGLEAAKALHGLGLETTIVEFAPRLMPRQLNRDGSEFLEEKIQTLGVDVKLGRTTQAILGNGRATGLQFKGGESLQVDMIVFSAGIRPRDELARASGLSIAERGGIVVDDYLRTSDPNIFALGEVASHNDVVYGLVAPGYEMADALACGLTGSPKPFTGSDMSTKLKLMGVDVASFGDPFAEPGQARSVEFKDAVRGIYKNITISLDGKKLLGGMLVGDATEYAQLLHLTRTGEDIPGNASDLIVASNDSSQGLGQLSSAVQVCSCNNVAKGDIVTAIKEQDIRSLDQLKAVTKAGTGCSGCVPLLKQVFDEQLRKMGTVTKPRLCEHFAHTRQELFQIVNIKKYESFDDLIQLHGTGNGCEVCKPAIASILASLWNEHIGDHEAIQDTNDQFFANIQRGGSYSVVPRVPGGEITPDKLIVLGEVAKKFDLYVKITGGQRIDLLGARVDQLPDIWSKLVEAGFESGHAYGKSVRTVKSCVGQTWCRFGVQDSTTFAIQVEERYRGIRAPHKIKMAVSGCIRECAEAQSKDIGIIATENGWNLYVCGNGGSSPRHADLFATDLDDETTLRYIDRVLMYYIHTADKLTRTARWLETLDGGLERLQSIVIDDSLGICEALDEDMNRLVDTYHCEWTEVVNDPEKQKRFRHFANSDDEDPNVQYTSQRGQKQPIKRPSSKARSPEALPSNAPSEWVRAGAILDFPANAAMPIQYGDTEIAVYNFASRNEWYATQNVCPHKKDAVLARGILGDEKGAAKIACPIHKKTFCLTDGSGISDPSLSLQTFPVKINQGDVYVRLPAPEVLTNGSTGDSCTLESVSTPV
jgi:nitrite reductase (NADH) large subunit